MRSSFLTVAVVGVGVLAACKIPKAPEWDIEVIFPYSLDTLSALDVLPSFVSVDTVGGTPVFEIQPLADSVEFSLGAMCNQCQALDGQTVQLPGFEYVDSLDVWFPADLVAIHVISALLEIRITNGLAFDPLRPNADPADVGSIAIVGRDIASGTTIDSVIISGATETMAPGELRTVQFSIADMEISEGVRIVFHILSPQDNQIVTIDANTVVEVAVLLGATQVREVAAIVVDHVLEEQAQIEIDQSVREELASGTLGGTFELQLAHSLDLEGDLQASIAGTQQGLFSGDPASEVAMDQLEFTSGLLQTRDVSVEQLQLIATFESMYVGYRAILSGTETGPAGQLQVAEFTPEQFLHVKLLLRSVQRIDF